MKTNYVKIVIPRKRTDDVRPVIELLGVRVLPEMDRILLGMLYRIYKEGNVKDNGIIGKTEDQKIAG